MNPPSVRRPTTLLLAVLVWSALGPASGCRLYRMERDLSVQYAGFLSDVRYLITASERKAFLSTPDGAKDRFIEEFWKKRDPYPDTAENELRSDYYARISQANSLFRTEGVAGWLSDRGRIWVLYGPPQERKSLNYDISESSNCREAWYYGIFPVVFVDATCSGSFRLETFDLSPIADLDISRFHGPYGTGEPGLRGEPGERFSGKAKSLLDFTASVKATIRREDRVESVLRLEIPLRLIWFKSQSGRFTTTFTVDVKVRDSKNSVVWEKSVSVEADYLEKDIQPRMEGVHVVEIPILIDQAESAAKIFSAPATVSVHLTNQTGSESADKTVEW